jgi:hypothetical protein
MHLGVEAGGQLLFEQRRIGADGIRLIPKLRSVRSRTAAISRLMSSGDSRTMPSSP